MNIDSNNSRSGYRAKRRKTNIVLNGLIILVLALIIIVAYNVFASGDDENAASSTKETPKTEQKATVNKDESKTSTKTDKSDEDSQKTAKTEDEASDESDTAATDEEEEASASDQADQTQATVTAGGSSSNVISTTINPSWKPVGTSQAGQHTAVYDENSADWQEMLKAISYATGIDQGNMTVYWLGRDRSTSNGSFATVATKDKTKKYNVYLQWVDGQGWQPTKMEELSEIQ
ncbi:YrrS family protein [Neobacillus sp. Marseille-QA0830]